MDAPSNSVRSRPGRHPKASPHGPFEELFEGIWFVRGGIRLPMLMPMKIGRSMTVVQGVDGLTLFNTMRLSEPGLRQLESLGAVKHVIRLGGFHGRDDGFYRERYGATVHALKGQQYVRGLEPNKAARAPYMEPDEWLTETSRLPIAGATLKVFSTSSPPEGLCIIERHGGIVISGDSLQNTPGPDAFYSFAAKLMMKRYGFLKAYNVGPGWLQFASPSRQDVRAILNLEFDHVLPGHGTPVIGGAKEKYRPAIEGPLTGCHE